MVSPPLDPHDVSELAPDVASDEEAPRLLGPADIRQLAAKVGIRPTKKLGQNFLHDPNTVRLIVRAADLDPTDRVIEVGPGLGSLTLGLLDQVARVDVVEIDARLAQQLPDTVAERAGSYADRLRIHHHDALTFRRDQIDGPPPTALVANLPYNVAVPVILHLLREFPMLRRVLVMVQAEVADRLAAGPGSKTYGVPSVKASFYGNVRRAGAIGKKVFWPEPKIDSGLVRIDVFGEDSPWKLDSPLRDQVFTVIDAAFAQRRKTLRAALKAGLTTLPGTADRSVTPTVLDAAFAQASIDPTLRGEALSAAEYVRLTTAIVRHAV